MIAIVTGASSGIGYEVCKQLLEKNYKVYGFSRRSIAPKGAITLCVDVSDEASVRSAVDEVARHEGRIDLLIANAGMGISGPVESATKEDSHRIMNVNFFGQVYASQAVLPYMRAQKSGTIVFTSSVAAPIAIPYQAFYSASKSAVNSVAMALRNEVGDYGIHVTVVMPGDTCTGFTDARIKNHNRDVARSTDSSTPYPRCDMAVASMERDERNGLPAAKVASVIVYAASKRKPAPFYVAGFKYRLLLASYNILPARAGVWLVGKFY